MILSREELFRILYWGNYVDFTYGLSEDDKILYDKIYQELRRKYKWIR